MNIIASYIYNTFLKSKKKHLLISGKQGSGKTTLFHQIINEINCHSPVLKSFKKDSYVYMSDGLNQELIGYKDEHNLYYGHPMRLVKDGFYKVGIPFIRNSISNYKLIGIDEIGFLESEETDFQNAVFEAMDKIAVIAVLRKQDIYFLNQLKNRDDVYLVDLDNIAKRFGCIIMASGMSKRYGKNKLFEIFEGKTFFEHAIDITDCFFEKRVVVTRDSSIEKLCDDMNIDVVLHDFPDRNDMIRLGMEKMDNMDYCMFVGCDQPMLKKESIEKMILLSVFNKDKIFQMNYNDKVALPTMFASCYFNELKTLPKKKGGSYVILNNQSHLQYVQCTTHNELIDIDTREDYIKLLEEINK